MIGFNLLQTLAIAGVIIPLTIWFVNKLERK